MIISPQVGLHENVVALDYDSEYANLIVNHNLSYETVCFIARKKTSRHTTIQRQQKGLTANSSGKISQKTALF
jgi:DNA polymerase elongation subunit (family B)